MDYLAGQLLLGKGQAAEALRRFNLALKKAAAHVPTLLAVGDYYLKAGDDEHAARVLPAGAHGLGQSVGAAVGLAEAHLAQRQAGPEDEKALAAVARILPGPGVPPAWRLRLDLATARVLAVDGQHDKAVAKLQEGLAAHAEDQAAYTAALADVDLLGGHYLEAEAAAQRALAKAPKDAEALERYAHILLGLGRYKQLLVEGAGGGERSADVARPARACGLRAGRLRRARAARSRPRAAARGSRPAARWCWRSATLPTASWRPARAALQQLGNLPHPAAATLVALGDLDQKAGDLKAAAGALQAGGGGRSQRLRAALRAGADAARERQADRGSGGARRRAQAEQRSRRGAGGLRFGAARGRQGRRGDAPAQRRPGRRPRTTSRSTSPWRASAAGAQHVPRRAALRHAGDDPRAPTIPKRTAGAARSPRPLKQKKIAQSEGKLVVKLEKKKRDDAKAKAKALAKRKHS